MITAGIIAEYNPFHSGHKYHIEETRRRTGADYVVIAMSGDFVQRGEPASADKYLRTEMALRGGADLVLELPAIYATSSAEYFASAGVRLLDQLHCVEYLSFGSEWADLDSLQGVVNVLTDEPKKYDTYLKDYLKEGKNFPSARSNALASVLDDSASKEAARIPTQPNHILALEYLKSLKREDSPIIPLAVKREGAAYHDENICSAYPSAAALRKALPDCRADSDRHKEFFAKNLGEMAGRYVSRYLSGDMVEWEDLMPYLRYIFLMEGEGIQRYFGMDNDRTARLGRIFRPDMSFSELIRGLHARNYTDAGWRRALLHMVLQMEMQPFLERAPEVPVPYARILGFSRRAAPLIKKMRERSAIPLIQKPVLGRTLLEDDAAAAWIYSVDIRAAQLYEQIAAAKSHRQPVSEWSRQQIIAGEKQELC